VIARSTKEFADGGYMMNLRVLGYYEDGESWAAHCLEMDLVGYGETFEVAYEKLKELIEMQIDFAVYKNQPTLIYHPAPPRIFRLYDLMLESYLQNFAGKEHRFDKDHRIANFPLPSISRGTDPSFVTC